MSLKSRGPINSTCCKIFTELKSLNLTDTAKTCPLPSLVICGSKDGANQASSKKLANLLPKGHYLEIADGGHLLNTQKPHELAEASQGVCW